MKQAFVAAGVSDIVDGSRPLAEDAATVVKKVWEKDNAKAALLISTTIEKARTFNHVSDGQRNVGCVV